MATTTKTKTTKGRNAGLSKRCECARRNWTKCPHPWHFDFYCTRAARHYGHAKFRFSLDVLAAARNEDPPRTKDAAATLADAVRGEIRKGVFVDPHAPAVASGPDPAALVTVADVIDAYTKAHVHAPGRRLRSAQAMRWVLGVIGRTEIPAAGGTLVRFDSKPMALVTLADIAALRAAREALEPKASKLVGVNRTLARLRHLWTWSVQHGHAETSPFLRSGVPVVRLVKEHSRSRRLREGEEAALLAVAGPHLYAVIVCALDTGLRIGEILSLQHKDLRTTTDAHGQPVVTLTLDPRKTKTSERRAVQASQRLAAVIAMRRTAPNGEALGADAFVFGTAVGAPVKSIRRAWATAVLRSHGHEPVWQSEPSFVLSPASRAVYRQIDLRFHDLRHEFGSLVLESGSSLAEARDLLGHSSISQTSSYLQTTVRSLGKAIDRLDAHRARLHARPEAAPVPPVEATDAATDDASPDRVQ